MVSYYVFAIFSGSILFATLFVYIILSDNVDVSFRIQSAFWIGGGFATNVVICFSASALQNEAQAAQEEMNAKIVEENCRDCSTTDFNTFQLSYLLAQQATSNMGITALGFFTVSKEVLLTTYSVIFTYVVVLLQSRKA